MCLVERATPTIPCWQPDSGNSRESTRLSRREQEIARAANAAETHALKVIIEM